MRTDYFPIAWRWYANGSGILIIALLISFGLVEAFAGDGAVLKRVGEVDRPSVTAKAKTAVSYGIDIDRRESCPGDVVISFRSRLPGGEGVVVRLPPFPVKADTLNPGIKPTTWITQLLPAEVGPGEWTYESGVQSHCPTRMRWDTLAKFDFKVVP